MDETTKTRKLWGESERAILTGKGIDIGCGRDPVMADARRFDLEHGDANFITRYVKDQFDFVYASHCLEHMIDPRQAILEWWQLVKVGGHLFFIVPDEDLYEQGVFPSRFNVDHKATFTISKRASWSPVSVNVLDLARSLPKGRLVSLELQDLGYDRTLLKHGTVAPSRSTRLVLRYYDGLKRRLRRTISAFERLKVSQAIFDQTLRLNTVAQIQCIVRKEA